MQLNANDWERSAFGGWAKNAIDSERKEFAKLFIKKHQSRSKTYATRRKSFATFFYFILGQC